MPLDGKSFDLGWPPGLQVEKFEKLQMETFSIQKHDPRMLKPLNSRLLNTKISNSKFLTEFLPLNCFWERLQLSVLVYWRLWHYSRVKNNFRIWNKEALSRYKRFQKNRKNSSIIQNSSTMTNSSSLVQMNLNDFS